MRQKIKKTVMIVAAAAVGYASMHFGRKGYAEYRNYAAQQIIQSTLVKIVGKRGYGSGVIIQSDDAGSYIITNKHVCRINKLDKKTQKKNLNLSTYGKFQVKKIEHNDEDEVTMTGQVLKVSENSDLCLIHVDRPNMPTADIAAETPLWGDIVHGYSNPQHIEGVPSTGRVLDEEYIFDLWYTRSSVLAQPGSSGSGVFNEDGELVGLISLQDMWYSYMVPLSHIRTFVKDLGI